MALRSTIKSDIRQHLRYGNIGVTSSSPSGGTLGANTGWRYFGEWSQLENRMNNMQPIDEAKVLGTFFSVILFQNLDPNAGDELVLSISGGGMASAQTITVTAQQGQDRDLFASYVAAAIARNVAINQARMTILCAAQQGLNGISPPSEIQIQVPSTFSVDIVSQTGNIAASVPDNGVQTSVCQVIGGVSYFGFLPICNQLYSLIGSSSDRMGVDKADVFSARKTEFADRLKLYCFSVNSLADFMVAPVNENPTGNRHSNSGSL